MSHIAQSSASFNYNKLLTHNYLEKQAASEKADYFTGLQELGTCIAQARLDGSGMPDKDNAHTRQPASC